MLGAAGCVRKVKHRGLAVGILDFTAHEKCTTTCTLSSVPAHTASKKPSSGPECLQTEH